MAPTMTVQAAFAATLVDEWVRGGVTDVVVSPGSRSTPLALAVAADGRLRAHVVLDERDAGFFALGLGLATERPAVVVTTSGTAAVELHPAVVEASQARVPLIVCTADRPPELHHVGAPQTVEQARLFGDAVRLFVEPGVADGLPPSTWRSFAARLVVEATSSPLGPGPVHANLAFRDPLVGGVGELPPGRPGGVPWHRATAPTVTAGDRLDVGGRRGVIVAGSGAGRSAAVIASTYGWPVLADPRSGCRGVHNSVAAFDGILRSERFAAAHAPEVVLRVGAPPASKVLSQWLAALPDGVEQWIVDPHGGWRDPERRAAGRLAALPLLEPPQPCEGGWLDAWTAAERAAQRAIDEVLAAHDEPTEPGTIRALTRDTPMATTFFVSSSMPIRDIEWFGHPSSTHRVLSNRGANGIDGVVATALAVATTTPVVAIVGDLAFLYDAGALLWANQRGADLMIVVIDNDGGGIFSFLPQRTDVDPATFERFFGTPHGVDVGAVAAAYGVPVTHVQTDRDANVRLHAELNAAIVAAVEATVG